MSGAWSRARLVSVAVLATALVLAIVQGRSLEQKARLGRPAPPFSLVSLSGESVSLQSISGQPVLLNFWATWCGPCREEAPAIETFRQRYGDLVRPIGIDLREPPDKVQAFASEFGLRYTMLLDQTGRVAAAYGATGLPETWFLDAAGVARFFWSGPMTFEVMQRGAEAALGRPLDGDAPLRPFLSAENSVTRHAIAFRADGGLWVGGRRGLLRHVSPGVWEMESGLPWGEQPVHALAAGTGRVAVAAGGRIWVSAVGSRSWRSLASPGTATASALAIAPGGQAIYAWVGGEGLWRWEAGTERWTRVENDLDADLPPPSLAVDGERLLLGTAAGLFESRDGGRTFQPTPFDRPVFGIAVGRELWLASDTGLFRGEGVRRLERVPSAPARRFDGLAVQAGSGLESIALLAPNGDVYTSQNGGLSWSLQAVEAARWRDGSRGGDRDEAK